MGSRSLPPLVAVFFRANDSYIDRWPSGSYGNRKDTIA